MHKYIIVFFSVLVFLNSCIGEDAPAGIIPEKPMTSLLTDMHIVNGSLYLVPQQADSLYKYGSAKYAALFKKYNTNDKQFTASLKYYSTRPEQMTAMYQEIGSRIQNKLDSLNKSNTKIKNALPAK